MDKIDPAYYAHTKRIDLKDETRINATNEEANRWLENNRLPEGGMSSSNCRFILFSYKLVAPSPNFISDIFYLTVAMSHLGYLQTIQRFNDTSRQLEDMQRHLDMINGDGSWMGVSSRPSSFF
jgi:ubiquitin conjugation factor E4 B